VGPSCFQRSLETVVFSTPLVEPNQPNKLGAATSESAPDHDLCRQDQLCSLGHVLILALCQGSMHCPPPPDSQPHLTLGIVIPI
jgi:hypothetical protein